MHVGFNIVNVEKELGVFANRRQEVGRKKILGTNTGWGHSVTSYMEPYIACGQKEQIKNNQRWLKEDCESTKLGL